MAGDPFIIQNSNMMQTTAISPNFAMTTTTTGGTYFTVPIYPPNLGVTTFTGMATVSPSPFLLRDITGRMLLEIAPNGTVHWYGDSNLASDLLVQQLNLAVTDTLARGIQERLKAAFAQEILDVAKNLDKQEILNYLELVLDQHRQLEAEYNLKAC